MVTLSGSANRILIRFEYIQDDGIFYSLVADRYRGILYG